MRDERVVRRLGWCVAALLGVAACGGNDSSQGDEVTVDVDDLYDDFPNTWRTMVSDRDELGYALVDDGNAEGWQPAVVSDCVASAAAGGNVARVQLTWVEDGNTERFDLTVAYRGFETGYFTTAFPVEAGTRFLLPPDSAYLDDEQAMLQVGPGVFPLVSGYAREELDDLAGSAVYTLTIEGLSAGLSYTIRGANLQDDRWYARKKYAFSTPICIQRF
jgi:hypothetical protein